MVEKITHLSCAACGGQVRIDRKQSMVHCPYCGSRYLVRDLLAEFALCPLCESLDRVEKVSAMPETFAYDRLFSWDFEDDDPDGDDWDDDDHRDKHPQQNVIWVVVVLALILMFLLRRVVPQVNGSSLVCWLPIAIVFLIGFRLILSGKGQFSKGHQEHGRKASFHQTLVELQQMEYRRLKPLYAQLLFCHRDGVIFLPGAEDTARPEGIKDYLRRHI